MAQTYRSRYLAVMREQERRMSALFAGLAATLSADVLRRADATGAVPIGALYQLQLLAAERVQRTFLGRTAAGEWAPFAVGQDGSVYPLSPYMEALWAGITEAVRIPVEQHAQMMRRRLPPDILAALGAQPVVREQGPVTRVFRPNPLAGYDPPHTWVDPAGYTLSERIWRVSGDTRRRLDAYLEDAIRQGKGALQMSRELEQFLLPGRELIRTRAPYGTDASYDAMRLARTENTRAFAQAAERSAAANPFVAGIRVVLSASHPKYDICDEAAAAGPWPKDEIPAQYQIPLHPHCLCSYRYEMIEDRAEVLARMRADIQRERAALEQIISPVQVEQFVQLLLRGWRVVAPQLRAA